MGKRRGAPPKPESKRKNCIVPIRMTAAEKAQVEAAADGNTSDWSREVLLRAARRKQKH